MENLWNCEAAGVWGCNGVAASSILPLFYFYDYTDPLCIFLMCVHAFVFYQTLKCSSFLKE